jgi:hypothetical protein
VREWEKRNPDKAKEYKRKHSDKINKINIQTLCKSYVASIMKISVNELSDDVYQQRKLIIQIKRKIKQFKTKQLK